MEENRQELHKKILLNLGITLFWIVALLVAGPWLVRFFMPLIVAWIIAMIANPLVSFLESRIKIMRKHGSMIVIAFVLIAVAAVIVFSIREIILQVSSWVVDLPGMYQSVVTNLEQSLETMHERWHFIPGDLEGLLPGENSKINDYILSALNSLQVNPVKTVGGVAGSVIDGLVLSILTIMIAYFFVADRDQMADNCRKYVPQGIQSIWGRAKKILVTAVGGYLKACFKIMFIMFLILLVFFLALRVEYAAVIAAITALLDFLPFIGTGTVLMPWAVYNILMGEYLRAGVLVAAYFVTLIVRRLIEPKLVGDSIGISPFLTLMSMFIGYRLIGMLGLIVGIPVGMILKELIEEGVFESQIRGIKILAEDIRNYKKY